MIFALSLAFLMIIFWSTGTCSGGSSTPRSPRATITPSTTARILSRFSIASARSSLAINIGAGAPFAKRSISSRTWTISSAVRTNDKATASTPCSTPNLRSFWSFSVYPDTRKRTPGRLMPLWELSSPPTITLASMLPSSADSTRKESCPSFRSIGSSFLTISNSSRKSTGTIFSFPSGGGSSST